LVGAPCKTGGSMVKLHVHSNEPGQIFKLCRDEFSADAVLQKEKVEDMFLEREQTHGKSSYDMSKAKVHVVIDACCLPYCELDHTTMVPIWMTHDATGEPMLLGDKNVNVCDVANNLRHHPSKFNTAAPSPAQMRLQFLQALKSGCDEILSIDLSSLMSAAHRNICSAREQLPEEDQAKITCYDSGYMAVNSCIAREALRCAEQGMTIAEMMPRLKHVDDNCYGFFVYSSTTVVRLAKWGRVPSLGDGSDVEDGQYFTMGMRPGTL